ncbi:MAG: cation:proton antiporter [Vicinamibacterales bacterium]|jgi:CPA2 family monovalent cation:H+ antiporter-2|nr:potassium transporter KefB [Acidobacteriota bacterium]MDP6371610.1 cation:proton antiporter [Vicinamibacterales bacterium]MDP6610197.1 cation:proton antiporter [Vicinamibacterales bacterium]HAK56328.1 potassium transporter KefB [Acidobacteriota bacterium]|tara:strand:+ start:3089 stop:5056 length:1968 start_codon:yes stop_codon:yes gene_type:complete
MNDLGVLRDLAIIVGLAIPVVALAHRLRMPPLVGFLLVGVAIGPRGAGLIPEVESVAALSEIGVVLLLFAIGLELSLSRVLEWGTAVLVTGGAQMLGMLAIGAAVGSALGLPLGQSLFYGALAAMSSTAVVSKTYADRDELDTPHAREVLSILVFQDLAIVPLMLLLPLLGGDARAGEGAWLRLVVSLAAMTALIAGGRLVVRWTLDRVVAVRDRELFTLCVGFFAVATALVASSFGFSLAIGAFLAGLIISESEYGLQALSDVVPFRALFSGVFFTSIGMLLDLSFAAGQVPLLLGAIVLLVVVKSLVAAGAVLLRGRPLATGLISGISLAQIGEFSFVLAAAGLPLGLFAGDDYQVFLTVAALSMMATPFLIAAARPIANRVGTHPAAIEGFEPSGSPQRRSDHAVIIGYGIAGRYLARMLRAAGIDCVVIEQNAELMRQAQRDEMPAVYGDGSRHGILEHANCAGARLIVYAISSPIEERRGVIVAREVAPNATIVVRTRYVRAIDELMRLGANEVVVEEFEASVELFARALESYEIPQTRIARELDAVRSEHYGLLRGQSMPDLRLDALKHLSIHDALDLVEVEEGAAALGGNPLTIDLRKKTGAVQVAVIRDGHPIYERDPGFCYRAGDTAILVGDRDALDAAAVLFRRG